MARPRTPPKPPDETPADASPPPEPSLPIAGGDDADEPAPLAGRASNAGAAPPPPVPVKASATPAGRKTGHAFVEGRRVAPSTQTDDVIRIRASENPNFILTLDPMRWIYYPQADRILPDFGKIRLVPGIGRVDAKGRPDAALVDAGKAGRTVIYDRSVQGGYLREFDMIGGVGFLCRWERIKVSGKSASVVVDFDEFGRFVDQLLEDGTIEPPADVAIEWLRDQAANMIRLSEPRKSSPSVAAEIEIYNKQIGACDRMLGAA
jgi:hypothetical protein